VIECLHFGHFAGVIKSAEVSRHANPTLLLGIMGYQQTVAMLLNIDRYLCRTVSAEIKPAGD